MQVLPSGIHFERATSYHRLVTEFFFYSYLLLKRTGKIIPLDIKSRIKTMLQFVMHAIKPDGSMALIGDNDDGRLLPFCKNDINDNRYLLSLGASEFNDKNFHRYSKGYTADCFFLVGEIMPLQNNCSVNIEDMPTIKVFEDAGFGILRGNEYYVLYNNNGFSRYANAKSITNSTSHTY